MKKFLGSFVMWIMGWKLDNTVDVENIKKCVIVAAPHTSNWDFIIAIASFWKMQVPMKLFIKDAWTKPWYGFIIKWLGGIGIDRSKKSNMTNFAAYLLKESERLCLLNTPEGTRSFAEKWKKGFYYIAKNADVPILLSYGDYKHKIAGIGKVVSLEDKTLEDVFSEIELFYKDINAKYPELYNPKIF